MGELYFVDTEDRGWGEDDVFIARRTVNGTERRVAEIISTYGDAEEIAEFIARACNAHDELVKALKLTAAVCAGDNCTKSGLVAALEAARSALSKAGA